MKTKALISCVVTAQLICGFVFAFAKSLNVASHLNPLRKSKKIIFCFYVILNLIGISTECLSKQFRPRSDCSSFNNLIRIYTVCHAQLFLKSSLFAILSENSLFLTCPKFFILDNFWPCTQFFFLIAHVPNII